MNWASLRADGPLHKIGACLLANEEYMDTYSALRHLCTSWCSDLPEPDVHLHKWIMVEHALPRAAEFSFLHLRTSRYVTIDLTEVHARFKLLHIYRVNLFLFSIVNILVLNVIFINIFSILLRRILPWRHRACPEEPAAQDTTFEPTHKDIEHYV
jgi:hypothetical protein